MQHRQLAPLVGLVAAMLAVCGDASAQNPPKPTGGTVIQTNGTVMVRRGARTFSATAGAGLQVGDAIMIAEGGSLSIFCSGAEPVRIATPGTFTYSGCQQVAAASPPPAPQPPVVSEPPPVQQAATVPPPASTPAPAVAKSGGGVSGGTLGIIGGVVVLAAAAGGGGGGGSKSSSPPASP